MGQLHKRFTDEQVKDMLNRYLNREIEGPYLQTLAGHQQASLLPLGETVPSYPRYILYSVLQTDANTQS